MGFDKDLPAGVAVDPAIFAVLSADVRGSGILRSIHVKPNGHGISKPVDPNSADRLSFFNAGDDPLGQILGSARVGDRAESRLEYLKP